MRSSAARFVVDAPSSRWSRLSSWSSSLSPLSVIGSGRLAEQAPENAHAQVLALFAAVVTATTGVGLVLAALLMDLTSPVGALITSTAMCVAAACGVAAASRGSG
jgi:hypothetical protein